MEVEDRLLFDQTMFTAKVSTKKLDALLQEKYRRLASGEKASTIADDPDVFFMTKALKDRAKVIKEEIDENISEAISTIQTAVHGLNTIKALVENAEGLLQNASSYADRSDLAQQYQEILTQIEKVTEDASYDDVNLLVRDSKLNSPFKNDGEKLSIQLRSSGGNSFKINGQFAGINYALVDLFNTQVAYAPNGDRSAIRGYNLSKSFVDVDLQDANTSAAFGNLQDIKLRFRINNGAPLQQFNTLGDVNGDGVVGSGEGFEADFLLDNSAGTQDSTGISFSNATIVSTPAFSFAFNTSANLSDAPAGSVTTTNTGTDLDANIPGTVPDGTEFTIQLDFQADGESYTGLTFGPMTVGAITSGLEISVNNPDITSKTVKDFTVKDDGVDFTTGELAHKYTDWDFAGSGVEVTGADYTKDMIYLTFNNQDPSVDTEQHIVQTGVRRDGVGLLDSWLYQNFATDNGVNGALIHISDAKSRIEMMKSSFQTSIDILSNSSDFNNAMAHTLESGADELQSIDIMRETAEALSLETQLSMSQLAMRNISLSNDSTAQLIQRLL